MKINTLVKISLIGFFGYLIATSNFFGNTQVGISWGGLVAGLAVQPFIFCCYFVLAARHVLLIGSPRIGLGVSMRAIALSQGLNLVLPVRLSELLKATYLRDHANVPLSTGISAVVLERSVDVLIVAALGVLGVILYFDRGDFVSIAALGLVLAVAILLLVRSPAIVLRIIHAVPSERLAGFLERTYRHFSAVAGTKAFWYGVLLGCAAWGLSYINILVFLELAGSIPVGLSGALLVFVLTTLGGAIPALPGGLGTYEAAAVIALRSLGYSFDEALVLAFAMHAAQLILPFVMAILIMLTERIGISSLLADLRKSATTASAASDLDMKGGNVND